jgi:hypothetical protein
LKAILQDNVAFNIQSLSHSSWLLWKFYNSQIWWMIITFPIDMSKKMNPQFWTNPQ